MGLFLVESREHTSRIATAGVIAVVPSRVISVP